jgi:transketolase
MRTNAGVERVRQSMGLTTGDEKHDESSTSTLDAIWVLYDRVLRVRPGEPDWEDRDRFILSKGHGPAAFYAVLADKGFFPSDELAAFLDYHGALGSHPDRTLVPGVEASTGSLGHGLPMAIGTALALRAKDNAQARVIVLCGDAELNEGSNWEAIMLAPHLRLSNLTLLVIDNHTSTIPMGPWRERLGSFGWRTDIVSGHDHDQLERALRVRAPEQPTAIIADLPEGEW